MSGSNSQLSSTVIARAANGDREAQRQVLEAVYQRSRRVLFRMLGPTDDLDDLHQDVLMRVLSSLPTYSGESKLSSWVTGICINVVRNHLRKKKWRTHVVASGNSDELGNLRRRHTDHPQRIARRDDLRRCFAALDRLSPERRTVLILKVGMGHSIEEIAEILDKQPANIKRALYLARRDFDRAVCHRKTLLGILSELRGGP